MDEKEKKEAKCYFKVVVPVEVGLGQALLPNLNLVDIKEPTFDDLFLIYIFKTPK